MLLITVVTTVLVMVDSKQCGDDGCDRPFYAKGLCKKHYRLYAVRECKDPDCDKPAATRGWCGMHYMRWWTHGDTDTVLGRRPESPDPNLWWCNGCREFKPLSEFGAWTDTRCRKTTVRYQSSCKKCQSINQKGNRGARKAADPEGWHLRERESSIRRLYGMSGIEFDELLASQGGTCANTACGKPHVEERGKRLHVDHDHRTGAVRGLLCNNCNRGIGLLGDDPDRLIGAARYLRKWQEA